MQYHPPLQRDSDSPPGRREIWDNLARVIKRDVMYRVWMTRSPGMIRMQSAKGLRCFTAGERPGKETEGTEAVS